MATRNSSSELVRSRQHPHAEIDQQRDARFLSKQMPGEAAGVFNNDDAHAVADNPLEQRREAWPPFDRILAAHCGVSKFVNDLETGSVGKSADGVPLAFLAIFVLTHVGRRARPVISQSWRAAFVRSCHEVGPCFLILQAITV